MPAHGAEVGGIAVIETQPAGGRHTRYFFRPHRFRSSLITAAVLWTARMVLCWDTSRRRRSRATTGPPISAVMMPASARRRMRCVSQLRKSAATGMVTVAGVTRAHAGILGEVGGPAYLTQLLTAMVGVITAGEYGRAIFDTWMRCQLIDIGETVVNNAFGAAPNMASRAHGNGHLRDRRRPRSAPERSCYG